MDALKFMNEFARMCDSYGTCSRCPLEKVICSESLDMGSNKRIIDEVEKWSKVHPRKTLWETEKENN